jgi:hypothetical protein
MPSAGAENDNDNGFGATPSATLAAQSLATKGGNERGRRGWPQPGISVSEVSGRARPPGSSRWVLCCRGWVRMKTRSMRCTRGVTRPRSKCPERGGDSVAPAAGARCAHAAQRARNGVTFFRQGLALPPPIPSLRVKSVRNGSNTPETRRIHGVRLREPCSTGWPECSSWVSWRSPGPEWAGNGVWGVVTIVW